MNADGSDQVNLTKNPGRDDAPVWSPDGTRIAFWSDRDGNQEIYVMHADGSGQVNLTNNPGYYAAPAWSPDGSRIAYFVSSSSGGCGRACVRRYVRVMNADGSGQVNLVGPLFYNQVISALVWSPDGSRIAFVSGLIPFDNADIYVMNADGSGQVNLTNNTGYDFEPAWRPR